MLGKLFTKYKEYKKVKQSKPEKVCTCFDVTSQDIVNAINNGCCGIKDVRTTTKAGTACGRCNSSVERHVHIAKKNKSL